MTPNTFIKLALAAAASSFAALAVYAASNTWSDGRIAGAKLAPALGSTSTKAASLVIGQGANTLTLTTGKDGRWTIKERADYPADPEPIRALLVKLGQAELVEGKTRNPERYSVLELEDPTGKDAKSKSLRVLDTKGTVLSDMVVGKRRFEAFGAGKSGTYVRVGKDPQTWLANVEIDVPTEVKRWIKPGIFDTDGAKLTDVKVEISGDEPLEITRTDGKLVFKGFPAEGKKLKDPSSAENLARAAAQLEADDVRKLDQTPAGAGVSVVTLKGDRGLDVVLRLRKDGDATWASVTASGDGEAKATAESINAKNKGWEYKIGSSKAEAILRKRADLQE